MTKRMIKMGKERGGKEREEREWEREVDKEVVGREVEYF